jgi:hypothetical protein
MKDLEDPTNQALYVPISYNLYDGLSPGMRLHNKTILDKPLSSTLTYSTNAKHSQDLVFINQNYRNSPLQRSSGSYFHYAQMPPI